MDSINLATREGLQQYLHKAPLVELREIASQLKLKFDDLPGEQLEDKSNELIAYVDRRNQLPELTLAAMRSYITKRLEEDDDVSLSTHSTPASQNGLQALSLQISSLNEQVQELRKHPSQNSTFEHKLEELAITAEKANKLTASVVLPSPESMTVRLVPIHAINRLKEYQSDENWAFLLLGLFSGGAIGVISNVANNEDFSFTRYAVFLIIVFLVLSVLSVAWLIRVSKRTKKFVDELNSETISNKEMG